MRELRRVLAGATVATLVGCAAAVAVAAGLTPPSGTPDMASMTVQPSDLAPDARLGTDAYRAPSGNFTAEYERDFSLAQAPAGGPPFVLSTVLFFAPKASVAGTFVSQERRLFGSTVGREFLSGLIAASVSTQAHLRVSGVHLSKIANIPVGKGSFVDVVSLRAKKHLLTADYVALGQGRVAGTLFLDHARRVAAGIDRTDVGTRCRRTHLQRAWPDRRDRYDQYVGRVRHRARQGRPGRPAHRAARGPRQHRALRRHGHDLSPAGFPRRPGEAARTADGSAGGAGSRRGRHVHEAPLRPPAGS